MKTIKTIAVQINPISKAMVPFGAEVFDIVSSSKDCFGLLAIVDTNARLQERTFAIYIEGKEIDSRCNRTNRLGRFYHDGEAFHVFDIS